MGFKKTRWWMTELGLGLALGLMMQNIVLLIYDFWSCEYHCLEIYKTENFKEFLK